MEYTVISFESTIMFVVWTSILQHWTSCTVPSISGYKDSKNKANLYVVSFHLVWLTDKEYWEIESLLIKSVLLLVSRWRSKLLRPLYDTINHKEWSLSLQQVWKHQRTEHTRYDDQLLEHPLSWQQWSW